MTVRPLELSRDEILAYRQAVSALTARLPPDEESLRHAAWAGLQDSMPRAALLSIHARVDGTGPSSWEDPSLVQVWGPRYSAYVVAAVDRGIFTVGRLPDDGAGLRRAQRTADRLEAFLDGRRMTYSEAGHALGVHPVSLRYGAPTGRFLMRWDGARQPTVWAVPRPDIDPQEARLELARRYLHISGPGTPLSFAEWAGIKPPRARTVFDLLASSLVQVRTPIGEGWILAGDEPAFRSGSAAPAAATAAATARLIPSGDTYFLLQGRDRELLVPDARRRALLWTPRVWPGAVMVAGNIVGTWRRADAKVTVQPWRVLTPTERHAVEAEAAGLPLPGIEGQIVVSWENAAD